MHPDEIQNVFPFHEIYTKGLWPSLNSKDRSFEPLSLGKEPSPGANITVLQPTPEEKDYLFSNLCRFKPMRLQCDFRCDQKALESITQASSLTGLEFGVASTFCDISSIARLSSLEELYFSTANKISDISCLSQMDHLKNLAFQGAYKSVADFASVELPRNIQTLVFSGGDTSKVAVSNLEFIGQCKKLRYLALVQLKVRGRGLSSLIELQSLEYLYLDFYRLRDWSLSDYRLLYEGLPNLKSDFVRLAATDTEFQKLHKIK
ncbi:hypothetical protein [Halioxenophilus aromaticivorans]|uniref:Uncharacterized protein n=1 Tax=Halioxenophilus aromaticivorans TaxID=1306992 RepID=A0AAV3U0H4_9ALTE